MNEQHKSVIRTYPHQETSWKCLIMSNNSNYIITVEDFNKGMSSLLISGRFPNYYCGDDLYYLKDPCLDVAYKQECFINLAFIVEIQDIKRNFQVKTVEWI